jgi:hypothetical protein
MKFQSNSLKNLNKVYMMNYEDFLSNHSTAAKSEKQIIAATMSNNQLHFTVKGLVKTPANTQLKLLNGNDFLILVKSQRDKEREK